MIAVIENPNNVKNIGTIIRNVNALGIEKAYIVTNQKLLPDTWEEMRTEQKLNAISVSAIKWSFVKIFKDTNSCMDHLDAKGFVSLVTSPHLKRIRKCSTS
ncbi:MAG: TrmH family RNA methyltransferase [Rickettsia endosymbiont of Argas persicus]